MDGAVARMHDARDDLGQRPRRVDGTLAARLDDRACDRAGMTLFAQCRDDVPKFAFAGPRDNVGGARAVAAHAPVQLTLATKRKAARGIVALHPRDANGEHNPTARGRVAYACL